MNSGSHVNEGRYAVIRDWIIDRVGFKSNYRRKKIDAYRDIVDPHGAKIYELSEQIDRTRLIGDLIFFAALILFIVLNAFVPTDPGLAYGLERSIHIPESLHANWPYDQPALMGGTMREYVNNTTMVGGIMFAGIASIIMRRWILYGLILALLLFPWSLVGINVPTNYALPIVLLNVASLSFLNIPKPFKGLVKTLAFIGAPLILMFITANASRMAPDTHYPKVKYTKISISGLNGVYPANKLKLLDRDPVVATSLIDLPVTTPAQQNAKNYVLAQEFALKKQPDQAKQYLDLSVASPAGQDKVADKRREILETYIAANGGRGDAVATQLKTTYKTQIRRSQFLSVLATLMLFAVPLSILISRYIENNTLNREEDRRITSPVYASGPADDLSALHYVRKIKNYKYMVVQGAGLLAILAMFKFLFNTPAAISNTAFSDVELVYALKSFGREFGWIGPKQSINIVSEYVTIQMAVMTAGLGYVIWKRRVLYFFIWLLAGQVSNGIVNYPTIANPDFEISVEKMDDRAVAALDDIVTNPTTAPYSVWIDQYYGVPGGLVPKFDHISSDLSPKKPAAIKDTQTAPVNGLRGAQKTDPNKSFKPKDKKGYLEPDIRRSIAAYTLAQRAYHNNDPEAAQRYLNQMTKSGRWRSGITRYRIGILQDWVAAHGVPVAADTYRPTQRVDTVSSRKIGFWLTIIIGAGIGLCLFLVYLIYDAYQRVDAINHTDQASPTSFDTDEQGNTFADDAPASRRRKLFGSRTKSVGID